ncbi:glutathione hydrolase 7-like [Symsagittifera roscoffensis]|uniref:glutathione hydrolase 7-like n=1 Tax=Symsagittifera roscoffensis TaxID=84072 RepID=UPI00307C34B1
MIPERDQKYIQHIDNGVKPNNVVEDVPLSTAYNLNPIVERDTRPKSFMDVHGKTVLVAGSGLLAAIVTLALIIDIIMGSQAVEPNGVVVSEIPACSKMGAKLMKGGASVVDGAIATSLCMAVHLPHRSGPGGGGYMLVKEEKKVVSYDFMPEAPNDIAYYSADNNDRGQDEILVPGFLSGLKRAHEDYGEEKWAELMHTAADVAKEYTVTSSLDAAIKKVPEEYRTASFEELFLTPNGSVPTELANAPLEKLLRKLAKNPDSSFLGLQSHIITDEVSQLKSEDLESYKVEMTGATKASFQNPKYDMFTSPSPSSGPALLSTLRMLIETSKSDMDDSTQKYHQLLEALKFTSSQQMYVADVEGNGEVVETMTSASNAGSLDSLIPASSVYNPIASEYQDKCLPDELTVSLSDSPATSPVDEDSSGVGVVVMNDLGDVAVIVTSLNSPFGSYILSDDGYFYNNYAAAFDAPGSGSVNEMSANKRPANTLAPLIAFEPENLCKTHLAASSSGSVASVAAVSQAVYGVLDNSYSMTDAVKEGRVFATAVVEDAGTSKPDEAFEDNSSIDFDVISELNSWGHVFNIPLPSEVLNLARKENDDVTGTSDIRVDSQGAVVF